MRGGIDVFVRRFGLEMDRDDERTRAAAISDEMEKAALWMRTSEKLSVTTTSFASTSKLFPFGGTLLRWPRSGEAVYDMISAEGYLE